MKKIILIIGDVAMCYTALVLTLALRYRDAFTPLVWHEHVIPFTVIFAAWIAVFYINNLYALSSAKNSSIFYSVLATSMAVNIAIAMLFFYLAPDRFIDVRPKTNLALHLIFSTVLLIGWRNLFNRVARAANLAANILIIADTPKVAALSKELTAHPQYGYRLCGVIIENEPSPLSPNASLYWDLSSVDSIPGRCKKNNIRTIILGTDAQRIPGLSEALMSAVRAGIAIESWNSFYERMTGKVHVATLDHEWFFHHMTKEKKLYLSAKRVIDVMLVLIVLTVTFPLLPLFWAAIKLEDPGSGFFTQNRMGMNGKSFLAIKLRTMRKNAEQNGPQWALPNDPRVTAIGKFLRKTRIDEIPQLLNILRGEMSFVGPRPERPEFVAQLSKNIPFYNERHLVKPGLTGWAQINFPYGSSEEDALEKLQYDLYYIKKRSITLDFAILLKTIRIIFSGSGQ